MQLNNWQNHDCITGIEIALFKNMNKAIKLIELKSIDQNKKYIEN